MFTKKMVSFFLALLLVSPSAFAGMSKKKRVAEMIGGAAGGYFAQHGLRKKGTGWRVGAGIVGAGIGSDVMGALVGLLDKKSEPKEKISKNPPSNFTGDPRFLAQSAPQRPYLARPQQTAPTTPTAQEDTPLHPPMVAIGDPATGQLSKPADKPEQFADRRPTLVLQIETSGWGAWFSGVDKEQFIDYVSELFAGRFQVLQAYDSRDLRHNMGEVRFGNSPWTVNSTARKTVGNMQNPDYQAYVRITVDSPKTQYVSGGYKQYRGRVGVFSTVAFATVQISPVNDRAYIERGSGKATGSTTQNLAVNARYGSYSANENGRRSAAREAAVKALIAAFKDLKRQ